MTDNRDRMHEIIADQLCRDPHTVSGSDRFVEDLECDSLDVVEIAMSIESAFGVDVNDSHIEYAKQVQDLYPLVDAA